MEQWKLRGSPSDYHGPKWYLWFAGDSGVYLAFSALDVVWLVSSLQAGLQWDVLWTWVVWYKGQPREGSKEFHKLSKWAWQVFLQNSFCRSSFSSCSGCVNMESNLGLEACWGPGSFKLQFACISWSLEMAQLLKAVLLQSLLSPCFAVYLPEFWERCRIRGWNLMFKFYIYLGKLVL